jgi:uncharacterized protein (DUF2164 family)
VTRISLSPERRAKLIAAIKTYYLERHEEVIGDLKSGMLLDFFVSELGPAVYNQAIRDAQAYFQQKIEDLEVEYFEEEEPRKS